MKTLIQLLIITLFATVSVKGDFVVTVGNSSAANRSEAVIVEAGGNVDLGIYLHSNLTNNPLSFRSLGLAFDISQPGAGFYDGNTAAFKTQFSNFSVRWADTLTGTLDLSDPSKVDSSTIRSQGYDLLLDLTPSAQISLPANGTQSSALHIATISFKVVDAPIGTYGFKFNPLAAFPSDIDGSANSTGPGGLTLEAGSDGTNFNRFSVTAVPEPSSFILGSFAIGIMAWSARRKRKHA